MLSSDRDPHLRLRCRKIYVGALAIALSALAAPTAVGTAYAHKGPASAERARGQKNNRTVRERVGATGRAIESHVRGLARAVRNAVESGLGRQGGERTRSEGQRRAERRDPNAAIETVEINGKTRRIATDGSGEESGEFRINPHATPISGNGALRMGGSAMTDTRKTKRSRYYDKITRKKREQGRRDTIRELYTEKLTPGQSIPEDYLPSRGELETLVSEKDIRAWHPVKADNEKGWETYEPGAKIPPKMPRELRNEHLDPQKGDRLQLWLDAQEYLKRAENPDHEIADSKLLRPTDIKKIEEVTGTKIPTRVPYRHYDGTVRRPAEVTPPTVDSIEKLDQWHTYETLNGKRTYVMKRKYRIELRGRGDEVREYELKGVYTKQDLGTVELGPGETKELTLTTTAGTRKIGMYPKDAGRGRDTPFDTFELGR